MVWTKDLGNVKGERGDIFVPKISTIAGKLKVEWEKKSNDIVEQPLPIELPIPIYIPTQTEDDRIKGNITFFVPDTIQKQYGKEDEDIFEPQKFHIKGDAGGTVVAFNTYPFPEDEEIAEYDFTADNNNISDNNEKHPNQHTFYIKGDGEEVWIYTPNFERSVFTKLEGMKLDDYYTKTETDNRIDEKLGMIEEQVQTLTTLLGNIEDYTNG